MLVARWHFTNTPQEVLRAVDRLPWRFEKSVPTPAGAYRFVTDTLEAYRIKRERRAALASEQPETRTRTPAAKKGRFQICQRHRRERGPLNCDRDLVSLLFTQLFTQLNQIGNRPIAYSDGDVRAAQQRLLDGMKSIPAEPAARFRAAADFLCQQIIATAAFKADLDSRLTGILDDMGCGRRLRQQMIEWYRSREFPSAESQVAFDRAAIKKIKSHFYYLRSLTAEEPDEHCYESVPLPESLDDLDAYTRKSDSEFNRRKITFRDGVLTKRDREGSVLLAKSCEPDGASPRRDDSGEANCGNYDAEKDLKRALSEKYPPRGTGRQLKTASVVDGVTATELEHATRMKCPNGHGDQRVVSERRRPKIMYTLECGCRRGRDSGVEKNWFDKFPVNWREALLGLKPEGTKGELECQKQS
jgi:hypothetical protein